MPNVLYLDCSSGASGDMLLGALLDLGVSPDRLRAALGGLLPADSDLEVGRVLRAGVSATSFRVVEPPRGAGGGGAAHEHRDGHDHDHHHHDGHHHGAHEHDHGHHHHGERDHDAAAHGHEDAHHHRSLADVDALISRAAISPPVRERARALYRRLAEVEAGIHGMSLERIHLHEVGALDSVVDIVGTVWALAEVGADRVVASPLNVGSGYVDTAHGRLSVPAPATARLLEGAPVYADGPQFELVTPTGALLVTSHASTYGPIPPMVIRRTGYGAGGRDIPGRPNVLRAILGEDAPAGDHHRVAVLECNIDDMNPQIFGRLLDRLYAAGALEVFYTPVQMKKGRPGTLVTAIVPPSRCDETMGVFFEETTTIGVRRADMDRECLSREFIQVGTRFGPVRFKLARRAGRLVNAAPEFDDCARLADEHGCPVKDVQAEAVRAYLDAHGPATRGDTDGT